MITKRAQLQFSSILSAAQMQALCIAKCFNITTGKPEYVLCAHSIIDSVEEYQPLAKLFQGNPFNEVTPPGASKYKLI